MESSDAWRASKTKAAAPLSRSVSLLALSGLGLTKALAQKRDSTRVNPKRGLSKSQGGAAGFEFPKRSGVEILSRNAIRS